MNLINDAINNHPANAKMQDKYGHLANLGPDGYGKGSGGGNYPKSNKNYPGKGGGANPKDNKNNKKGQNGMI